MRFVVVIVFALALTVVIGAAVVAARGGDVLEGVGSGPGPDAIAAAGADGDAASAARAQALAIAKDVSGRVTPEMGDALTRLVERGKPKGAAYREWSDFLARLRAQYRVTSLYAMVKLDRQTAGVVVEAVETPEAADGWLALYEIEPGMRKAFRGRAANSGDPPFFDPRIRNGAPHVRALAPIRDSDGEVVAIVGVDVEVGDRQVGR